MYFPSHSNEESSGLIGIPLPNHQPSKFNPEFQTSNSLVASSPSSSCPPQDKHLLQPLIVQSQHDSSSERDSGTGDSRKSRDNLDEVDESLADFRGCFTSISKTKHGGGESTVDFEDFEDTTTMTPLADIHDDDDDDDLEEGCGEAILSASNSLVIVSNLSSANNSEIGDTSQLDSSSIPGFNEESTNIILEEHKESLPAVTNLRTFLVKNKSLSRDFLNEQDTTTTTTPINRRDATGRGWRRMGGSRRKRASAVDINGEIYLEFERGCDKTERRDDLDPLVYRGGTASRVTNGMEFHERLLEHSFNSTDYSLRESQIMRNGRERRAVAGSGGASSATTTSYVNSLPRSKRKKSREKQKLKSQHQQISTAAVLSNNPPSLNLNKKENHSDVAQRADELFS